MALAGATIEACGSMSTPPEDFVEVDPANTDAAADAGRGQFAVVYPVTHPLLIEFDAVGDLLDREVLVIPACVGRPPVAAGIAGLLTDDQTSKIGSVQWPRLSATRTSHFGGASVGF
jgi:hypothetical protein